MQKVSYSTALNSVITEIKTPFFRADLMLGWPIKSIGLGFNKQIINSCLEKQADLIVRVGYNSTTYFIRFAKLKEALDTLNCDYTVKRDTQLKVIPWDYFAISGDIL